MATQGGAACRIFDGAEPSAGAVTDPVVAAISAYLVAMEDFRRNAPDDDAGSDAYALATYRRPLKVLERWRRPAETRIGAVAALRLASDAETDGAYELVGPMLRAGLAYFDK
ncbi:hypothetical protein E5S70_07330 [Ensifer adhaerens]|uniref:hypothetical protein n=1 Tax=Ensifer canadensis TaxID=555315 RepID=UPI0014902BE9|nr:hypothetical protein [Ensifer canadensis]NOV15897.1 hypothetical protein [Ensifer canadensis]